MNTKEFAELIGVSRVTLSKVINRKEGVSPKTRRLVEEYITKYNFTPNNAARNLAGKKNNIIGLFFKVSSVSENDSETTSHFTSEYTNFAINEAQKRGYKVLVGITNTKNQYYEILNAFNSGIISGAILSGHDTQDREMLNILSKENKVLVINQEEKGPSEYVKILNVNDVTASYKAMQLLVEKGRKDLLYIGVDKKRLPALRREKGIKSYCEENKTKLKSLRIKNGDFTEKSGYKVMTEVLSSDLPYPNGIFAANDFMALGAMRAIKDHGLKIPEDISIIGFDDIQIAKYSDPPLSTMRSDFQEVAVKSINTLIDFIEEKKVPEIQEWNVEFINRKTL